MLYLSFKRFFDFFISILLLVINIPLIVIVIILIILFDHQSPFFIQKRAGKNGKAFNLIKLQTMKTTLDLNNGKSITSIGYYLRKYKIDEIPQLINIILGDLSLVGPRPLLLSYNELYNNYHRQRLNIKPGLTGLAQINILDNGDWNKKLDLDVVYVKNMSFLLDLKIIYKSFKLLFLIVLNKVKIKEDFNTYKNKS